MKLNGMKQCIIISVTLAKKKKKKEKEKEKKKEKRKKLKGVWVVEPSLRFPPAAALSAVRSLLREGCRILASICTG